MKKSSGKELSKKLPDDWYGAENGLSDGNHAEYYYRLCGMKAHELVLLFQHQKDNTGNPPSDIAQQSRYIRLQAGS